jgi:hypothetical protein
MKAFPDVLYKLGLLLLSITALATSCKCDLTNASVGARVVIQSITAPPGGPSQRFLEVSASGFHPNAQAEINIPSYPTLNGPERLQEKVTFDAQGKLNWRKSPVTFLIGSTNDPNADISITVKEVNSDCFAATSIKQREFMKLH